MNQKKLCYLIDDDADDQEIFAAALQELSIPVECITADNGIEALELLRNDPSFIPDYIFIDLNMPRMNGRECLVEIRKIPHLVNTPLVVYTTSSENRDVRETRLLGANHFLTKHFSLAVLSQRLADFFQKKENNVPVEFEI